MNSVPEWFRDATLRVRRKWHLLHMKWRASDDENNSSSLAKASHLSLLSTEHYTIWQLWTAALPRLLLHIKFFCLSLLSVTHLKVFKLPHNWFLALTAAACLEIFTKRFKWSGMKLNSSACTDTFLSVFFSLCWYCCCGNENIPHKEKNIY